MKPDDIKIQKAKKDNDDRCNFCNTIFFFGDEQIIFKKMIFCSEDCIKEYEDLQ